MWERSQIAKWLQQVAQGNGGILFITGDWGIGRSSLLRDAVVRATELGLVTADTCLLETGWLEQVHGQAQMLAKRHPLVREAIYESIPARQRAHLHRQIAEQLEGNHIALPDEQRWLHWRRSEPDETVLARLWDRSER